MRSIILALLSLTLGGSATYAQGLNPAFLSRRAEVSLGYNYTNANAPPAGCDCFGMSGGYVSAEINTRRWLSVAGKFTGGHANDISTLGQNLTLLTFTVGPKVSLTGRRLAPFGQFLIGGAHASDSYFPSGTSSKTTATSFAYITGGGMDVNLSSRFAVRAFDVEFLRTAFPNGANDRQNHLTVGAGIVMKLGHGSRF
ncbi:MAG: outer membrane beta-barrel protein [Janthinobacterium lividum]